MASNLELSDYEIIRQQNIEKNKELLRSLGLAESKQQFRQSTLQNTTAEKIKRKYTKRKFIIHELRRSSRKQGKPVRYTDDFLESIESLENSTDRINTIALYGYKPKYKNEITTCHYCYVRNRKPKTKYVSLLKTSSPITGPPNLLPNKRSSFSLPTIIQMIMYASKMVLLCLQHDIPRSLEGTVLSQML